MRKILALIPRQVLMAMICGVLLPYGLAIFSSLNTIPFLTLPSLAVYLVLQFTFPKLGKRLPPLLAAVVVALGLATLTGATNWSALELKTASVVFGLPSFNLATIVELALPLAITALSFGDGQAYAILVSQGYNPPVNAMTSSSGIVSMVNALFGGHTGCMGGILQGIVAGPQAGEKEGRFAGVVAQSVLWVGLAVFAPVAASINKVVLQSALMPMLGGIALANVTVGAFEQAFSGKFRLSALLCFLVTFSGFKFANVGSVFWGLVVGLAVAYGFERADFKQN
jgi:benzoate membrane transport protein